jgi:hypothetical protein
VGPVQIGRQGDERIMFWEATGMDSY